MPRSSRSKRAPRTGAFFVFCSLLVGVTAHGDECPRPGDTERVRVAHVYDGDTVRLADGRRVRLIGINAPEAGRGERLSQPYAAEAGAALAARLARHDNILWLQSGTSHRDHYGRLLAHAFLPDGSDAAAQLLAEGLATALVVPPNTAAATCYQGIEARARRAGLGIWSLEQYRAVNAARLPAEARGFRLVTGRVEEIRESRHSIWLQLDGPLVVHISRRDLAQFPGNFPQALAGRHVEARGWLKPDRDGLRMHVRHPAALVTLDAPAPEQIGPNG